MSPNDLQCSLMELLRTLLACYQVLNRRPCNCRTLNIHFRYVTKQNIHKHHDFTTSVFFKQKNSIFKGTRMRHNLCSCSVWNDFRLWYEHNLDFAAPVRQRTKSMGFMTLKAHKVNSTVPIMFCASRMARKYCIWHLINFVRGFKHNRNIRHMLNQSVASHLSVTHLHLNREKKKKKQDWRFAKPIKPVSGYKLQGRDE